MEILNPELDLESFFKNLSKAQKRALMLDYDGTLAPFKHEREKAVPYPGVRELLRRLVSAGRTRLVIVSGRRVRDLAPLIDFDVPPEIWGCHGFEHLTRDGKYILTELVPSARQGLAEAETWIAKEGLASLSEKKPSGVAFHWRGMTPDQTVRLKEKIQKKWLSTAQNFGLILQEFDGGLELRVSGITKGNVVKTIIKETGANAVLTYLGDDLTDEDAFNALHGHGLGVLVSSCLHETAADVWIKPPEELLAFLEKWIECGG